MHTNTILEKDIPFNLHKIPSIMMGFEPDDEDESSQGSSIRLVKESTDVDDLDIPAHNDNVIKNVITGRDYHGELDSLHRNFKFAKFNGNDTKFKAQDSLIYDILKKGKPSNEHLTTVLDNMNPFSEAPLHQKYLPFLHAHVAKKSLEFEDPGDAIMTPAEINSIKAPVKSGNFMTGQEPSHGYNHNGLRTFSHSGTGEIVEHHPQRGLELVHIPNASSIYKKFDGQSTIDKTNKIVKDIADHTKLLPPHLQIGNDDFRQYSGDSAAINSYHHLLHSGKLLPGQNQVHGEDIPFLEHHTESLDAAFNTAGHNIINGKPLQVYTGVYREHNLGDTSKRATDEKGNIYYHNPGYTSTSADLHTAIWFAKGKEDSEVNGRRVREVVSLSVPEWHPHARLIAHVSNHANENEFLLNRGSTFKISPTPLYLHTGHSNDAQRIWHGQVVPVDTEPNKGFLAKSAPNQIIHMMNANTFDQHLLHEVANAHANSNVRAAAVYHPNFLHEKLDDVMNQGYSVRSALLSRKVLPEHLIDATIRNGDSKDMKILARRNSLLPKHRAALIDSGLSSVQAEMAHRADLHPHEIDTLHEYGKTDDEVMAAIANHPKLGIDRIKALTNHPRLAVRQAIASNVSTPHSVLHDMNKSDSSFAVSQSLQSNPNFWKFKWD